jgi:hypothetical protein
MTGAEHWGDGVHQHPIAGSRIRNGRASVTNFHVCGVALQRGGLLNAQRTGKSLPDERGSGECIRRTPVPKASTVIRSIGQNTPRVSCAVMQNPWH